MRRANESSKLRCPLFYEHRREGWGGFTVDGRRRSVVKHMRVATGEFKSQKTLPPLVHTATTLYGTPLPLCSHMLTG